jgi:glucose-6-phosphate isomerase
MNRQKIKLDLSNYIGLEKSIDFSLLSKKAFDIVSMLYKSKQEPSKMTGWLNLPHDKNTFEELKSFTSEILAKDKYEHVLVFGIGGSSLGAQALIDGIKTPLWNRLGRAKRKGFLTVDFVDNLDPIILRTTLNKLKLDRTLFLVVSKGGETIETIIPMLVAKEWVGENFYKQCVFITSVETRHGVSLLCALGKKNNVPVFPIPENVGGRYSVFSPVGLLPSSFSSINLDEVQQGLLEADNVCQSMDLKINLAVQVALCAYTSYINHKNIFVLMPYSSCLKRFVDWFIQLWAESLGKNKKGSTPLSAIGACDQHSQIQMFNEGPDDKLICFIKINKHKKDLTIGDFSSEHDNFKTYSTYKVGQVLNIELEATKRALTENSRPNITITLPELDEYYLAELMFLLEMTTSVMGHLLEVNPFDQPGVELAKRYTKEILAKK